MSRDYTNPEFKKLLQKLQEESWQLELLISGFAIFGLINVFPVLTQAANEAQNSQQIYKFVVASVGFISCAILIFNLLLHVLLRGLWIGALGLRYVSGDIDYEVLNYSQKFTKYLKKKVGSFDKYIGTLENYCSIIFAISFLLIFYVLTITFTIITFALIGNYVISNESLPNWISNVVGPILMVFLAISVFLSFIDFATQGFLKKKKWISRFYFPIYWVFSFITFSFLYRPLVYNFLDNKFGKRLSFVLVPIYILILLATSLRYQQSNYIGPFLSSDSTVANNRNYEDMLKNTDDLITRATIQSKIITEPYIKVFIPFSEIIEDRVFYYNPGLKPEKDKRGLGSDININGNFTSGNKRDSLKTEYLKTFNSIYYLKIDSLVYDTEFILAKSLKEKLGFETYLGTKSLTEGKHLISVKRRKIEDNDTTYLNVARIPFWYYKD